MRSNVPQVLEVKLGRRRPNGTCEVMVSDSLYGQAGGFLVVGHVFKASKYRWGWHSDGTIMRGYPRRYMAVKNLVLGQTEIPGCDTMQGVCGLFCRDNRPDVPEA